MLKGFTQDYESSFMSWSFQHEQNYSKFYRYYEIGFTQFSRKLTFLIPLFPRNFDRETV